VSVTTRPEAPTAVDDRDARRRTVAVPTILLQTLDHNWAVALVLAAGAALRLAVMLAYNPVFWFTDTHGYLRAAELGRPGQARPWG
jgi:hypothetical protein